MATTIAVLSQKGGTGKTTTVRTLADILGRVGLDVLAVDLDPQANLSDYFDVDADAEPTVADVLDGRARAVDAVRDGVLPSNLGLLTVNALVAADYALLSTEAQYFSLQGVEQALELIDLARDSLHPDLEWLGVVLNIADLRTIHSREALEQLRERFEDKVFEAVIRQSIRYAESAERGVSILDYRPELGADYVGLAEEVLDRIGLDSERDRVRRLRSELVAA